LSLHRSPHSCLLSMYKSRQPTSSNKENDKRKRNSASNFFLLFSVSLILMI
jgi:hypothetical protein